MSIFIYIHIHPRPFYFLLRRLTRKARLMIWIFLVDSSHTIFYGCPPRLMVSELTCNLPCPDTLFDLSRLFYQQAQPLQYPVKVASLSEGVSLLMCERWSDDTIPKFGLLSHLDLFVFISGMCTSTRMLGFETLASSVVPSIYFLIDIPKLFTRLYSTPIQYPV